MAQKAGFGKKGKKRRVGRPKGRKNKWNQRFYVKIYFNCEINIINWKTHIIWIIQSFLMILNMYVLKLNYIHLSSYLLYYFLINFNKFILNI